LFDNPQHNNNPFPITNTPNSINSSGVINSPFGSNTNQNMFLNNNNNTSLSQPIQSNPHNNPFTN